MISRVLWLRRILRRREQWSEQELREHQRRETAALARSRRPGRRSTGTSTTALIAPRPATCRRSPRAQRRDPEGGPAAFRQAPAGPRPPAPPGLLTRDLRPPAPGYR